MNVFYVRKTEIGRREILSGGRASSVSRRKKKHEAKRPNLQIKKGEKITIYVATAGYVCQGLYEGRKRRGRHVDL